MKSYSIDDIGTTIMNLKTDDSGVGADDPISNVICEITVWADSGNAGTVSVGDSSIGQGVPPGQVLGADDSYTFHARPCDVYLRASASSQAVNVNITNPR